jgi:hypothetical protein
VSVPLPSVCVLIDICAFEALYVVSVTVAGEALAVGDALGEESAVALPDAAACSDSYSLTLEISTWSMTKRFNAHVAPLPAAKTTAIMADTIQTRLRDRRVLSAVLFCGMVQVWAGCKQIV